MRTLLTTLLCLCLIQSWSQFSRPEHRVVLVSGEEIRGQRLVYQSPILNKPFFSLDNEKIETNSISFFQNNHGYFASLGRIHGLNTERYAMRINVGKMNLYEEVDMTVYGKDDLAVKDSSGNMTDPMLASGDMFEYYNIGDQPVREAKYANLLVDLKSNEMSIKHLHRYRNYKMLQWGLVGAGAGIIAANIMAQSSSAVRFNPVMALGIVIGGGSYFLETPKEDELWLAADSFNKGDMNFTER